MDLGTSTSTQQKARELAEWLAKQLALSGSTEQQIADEAGVSQSTVSRAKSGHRTRPSDQFNRLCNYALRAQESAKMAAPTPEENSELMEALRHTWDGTAVHAKRLSAAIRSLKPLSENP